jgi:predicted kinase
MVILVFGLPGSGKTTLAEELAGRLKAVYLGSDPLRKEMIRDISYTAEEKSAVYDRMLELALDAVVRWDDDVVADANFHLTKERQLFQDAFRQQTALYLIEIRSKEELIRERLSARREDSDADFAVYEKIRAEWEPEDSDHLVLWSERDNLEEMVRQALDYVNILYEPITHL